MSDLTIELFRRIKEQNEALKAELESINLYELEFYNKEGRNTLYLNDITLVNKALNILKSKEISARASKMKDNGFIKNESELIREFRRRRI